ncbi:endo-1,4-beta-xylanase [Roseateles paludis]|jgi:endo-1,4-beta-xylanase|uniref:Beta-xylanase n=1 Tax=Roseateles paludis TaxID=3145238 RepID=A0ABV0G408_9BURK
MTIDRRHLLLGSLSLPVFTACGGGGGGSAAPTPAPSPAPAPAPAPTPAPADIPALKTYFASNFKIGMAADPNGYKNAIANPVILKHANSITAENAFKPDAIGRTAGSYNWATADELITWASANGIAVRGHTLCWHSQTPDWLTTGTAAEVRAKLETYVRDVVTHFKGKVYCWDVVNECTSDDASSAYRNSKWYQILGADYIEIALRAARAADPDAKLFINDYGTEDPAKLARLMTIVADMQARGAPLDGIGHQLHVNVSWPPVANVDSALRSVANKGLINHVTELDVSLYNDPGACYSNRSSCLADVTGDTAALATALKQQALQYRALFNVFKQHPSLQSVTTWGIADNSTWLTGFPTNRGNLPLLFDKTGAAKSAARAITDDAYQPT